MPKIPIELALEQAGRELQERHGIAAIPSRELVARALRLAGCSSSSVLPSDYAYNRINRGVSRIHPMFIQEGRGLYRYVGRARPYTGPIYWRPVGEAERQVGSSVSGVVTFTQFPRIHEDPAL